MDKKIIMEKIDSENGKDFYKNLDLKGCYNFYKNESFISFRVCKVEGIDMVNIKYLYAENKEDLMSILAYCVNFWTGIKIKFIYYKEKEKKPYVVKALKNLGFKVVESDKPEQWKHKFECIKGEDPCNCKTIEAFI